MTYKEYEKRVIELFLETGNYATKEEKLEFLNEEFEKKGIKAGLQKIEKMLAPFNLGSMPEIPAAITVNRANQILNSF